MIQAIKKRLLLITHSLGPISTLVLALFFSVNSSAQLVVDKTLYRSPQDELLTIKKISLLPVIDNVGGIYSRPLENHLTQIIKNDHHMDYIPLNFAGALLTPEELETNPQNILQITKGLETDAVIATRVIKGPQGINIKFNLFLAKDGKLFSQALLKDHKRFEIEQLKEEISKLYKSVLDKIPYQGLILSRQGNLITTNLGKKDGIQPNKIVSVIQIIKLNRHPKFNFLINTEKEIIGKVKLLKIDDTLSFGKIVTEKEPGAIQKDAKISGLDFVKYGATDTLTDSSSTDDQLMKRPDGLISFGKNATAWLPRKPPTFGQVGAFIGDSLYSYNMQLTAESLAESSYFNPFIVLDGELWMTPNWTIHSTIKQGILSISNGRSGSTPSDLSASWSYYNFSLGYKMRVDGTIWGPQVEIIGGFSNYDMRVDDSSPRGFTSTKYSGLKLGLKGSYPVDRRKNYGVGADLNFVFNPNMSESPVKSGLSPTHTVNQFGLFTYLRLGINLKAQLNLDFDLYKTNWNSITTASSSSQRHTSLSLGLYWMF